MIVKNEDLPEGLKKQQEVAHTISQYVFNKIWNISVKNLHQVSPQVDGNSALSFFSTIIVGITGRWLVEMIKIADKDDAGIEGEEIVKNIFNAIALGLGGEIDFKEEDKPLPDGIKRLKK